MGAHNVKDFLEALGGDWPTSGAAFWMPSLSRYVIRWGTAAGSGLTADSIIYLELGSVTKIWVIDKTDTTYDQLIQLTE